MSEALLEGLTVVELGELVMVPRVGKVLREFGARVVKVETPHVGDAARRYGPFPNDVPDPECSGLFVSLNAGKESATLDVTTSTGRCLLKQLLAKADVFLHGFRPDELVALELESNDLLAEFPRLIIAAATGFGQTGPRANWRSTDLTALHASGVGHRFLGDSGQRPLRIATAYADTLASQVAVHGIMVALRARRRDGYGQLVDVGSADALASIVLGYPHVASFHLGNDIGTRVAEPRLTLRAVVPSGRFRCIDGTVQISTLEARQWRGLADAMGNPPWTDSGLFTDDPKSRQQHPELITELVSDWMATQTQREVFEKLSARDVPCIPCGTPQELIDHPHFREAGTFREVCDGRGTAWLLAGVPWSESSGESAGERSPRAPRLGEHIDSVMQELGLSRDEIEGLRMAGIV